MDTQTDITAETATAVFAAAAQAAGWKAANTGLRVDVSHAGYRWTVELPSGSPAEITHREGFGGVEVVQAIASWGTTVGLVDAAMAAVRP